MHQEHLQILFSPIFEFLNSSILLKSRTFFLFINSLMSISLKISWTPLILAKSVIHSIQGGHAWAFLNSLQLTPKLMVFTSFQGCQFKYLPRKFYLEKYILWILTLGFYVFHCIVSVNFLFSILCLKFNANALSCIYTLTRLAFKLL